MWASRIVTAAVFGAVVACIVTEVNAAAATDGRPHWPQFRGPDGRGVAERGQFPVRFGLAENLLWKAELPRGQSSPCIWDDYILLTGLADGRLETLCLDRRHGRILWRRAAPADGLETFAAPGGPAAATPVTDGSRVYVYFGSYGLLCYDFTGRPVWSLPLPKPITGWGAAASPILAHDYLVIKCDQDVGSYLLAVDRRSGRPAWRTGRDRFRRSYGTPIVWRHDAASQLPDELIVPGALELAAYDLHDGHQRWSVRGLPADMCTTPVTGSGLLFVSAWGPGGSPGDRTLLPAFADALRQFDRDNNGRLTRDEVPAGPVRRDYGEVDADKDGRVDGAEWTRAADWFARTENALLAIRPGGQGDVTQTHVVWKQTRGLPYVPSPLHYRGRIYLVKDGGILSCFDAGTGEQQFQGRLPATGTYHTSPTAADGKIYVASRRGVVVVLQAGDQLKVLAQNDLKEEISATPALVDDRIYVRTSKHLFAFGRQ